MADEYTPSELAVRLADEWLEAHRKTDAWRIVNMLRDEVVRLATHDATIRRDAAREALDGLERLLSATAASIGGHSLNAAIQLRDEATNVRTYRDTHYPETEG